MSQIVENAPFHKVEKFFKKFPDPDADDFQNLLIPWPQLHLQ